MKRWLLLLLLLLLGGCGEEQYTPIHSSSLLVTANIKEGSISFMDTKQQRVLGTWQLKKALMGTLLLQNKTLLVYGKQLEKVYLYDVRNGKQIGAWSTGKGIVNAVLTENGLVAFANQRNGTVDLYTTTGKEQNSMSVGNNPMTMIQQGKRLYVLNFQDPTMSVLDIGTSKLIETVTIPIASIGAVAVGDEIWIGGHGNGEEVNESVHVYKKQLERSIPTPKMPIALVRDENYVYVLSHGSNRVYKINKDDYHEEASVEMGANPFSLALIHQNLYVASYDSDEVYVVDVTTMKTVQVLKVGKGPFHIGG